MPIVRKAEIDASFGFHLQTKREERNLTREALADAMNEAASIKTQEQLELEQTIRELEEVVTLATTEMNSGFVPAITAETIRAWEIGSNVPNEEETLRLAEHLFEEGQHEDKQRFINLANQDRSL